MHSDHNIVDSGPDFENKKRQNPNPEPINPNPITKNTVSKMDLFKVSMQGSNNDEAYSVATYVVTYVVTSLAKLLSGII